MKVTLTPTQQDMYRTFKRFESASERPDKTFYVSSKSLQKWYGNQYARELRGMYDIGFLRVAEEFVKPWIGKKQKGHEGEWYKYKKGKCRYYAICTDTTPTIDPVELSDKAKEYMAVRAELKMPTDTAWLKEGTKGDSRDYSDFSQMKREERKALCAQYGLHEFDFHNMYAICLLATYDKETGKATPDAKELIYGETLYDFIADVKPETRPLIKEGINKGFNDPAKRLKFNGWTRIDGEIINMPLTNDEREMRLGWKILEVIDKGFTKWCRTLAQVKGRSYRTGARMEKQIRDYVTKSLKRYGINCLTVHDGFYVPEAAVKLMPTIMADALNYFITFNNYSEPSSNRNELPDFSISCTDSATKDKILSKFFDCEPPDG